MTTPESETMAAIVLYAIHHTLGNMCSKTYILAYFTVASLIILILSIRTTTSNLPRERVASRSFLSPFCLCYSVPCCEFPCFGMAQTHSTLLCDSNKTLVLALEEPEKIRPLEKKLSVLAGPCVPFIVCLYHCSSPFSNRK